MTLRIYRDAGAEGGGAPQFQPSMAELRNPKPPIVITADAPILGPDGKPVVQTIPDAAAEEARIKAEGEAANVAKGLNPDGSPKTIEKTAEQIAEEARLKAEGKNPDGTPIVADTEMTDDEMVADFWKQVDIKSGKPVKVEYPEGVDPLGPDGIYLRDQAIREQAQLEFEAAIKAANPRGYAYLMHLENGGTDEEFLGKGAGFLLPERTVVEGSVESQTMILKTDLKGRGLDDEAITAIVDKAIKDNKLKEKSLVAFDNIQLQQKTQLENIQKQEQQSLEQERQIGIAFNNSVDKAMKEMRLVVPDTDIPGFKQFINENVRIDNGQIFLVRNINTENLKQQMETLFFSFKNGDLGKIIQKQAATQTSQRLRTQVDKTKLADPKTSEPNKTPQINLSLADMWKKRSVTA